MSEGADEGAGDKYGKRLVRVVFDGNNTVKICQGGAEEAKANCL